MTTTPNPPQNGNGNSHGAQTSDTVRRHAAPPRPGAGMGWKLTLTVIVLAAALCVGFYFVHHHKADEQAKLIEQTSQDSSEAPTVEVETVKPAPSSQALVIPGETHGWYQSTIYARVDGYVQKWNVDIGDRVRQGEVLATIATPDLDAQLQASLEQLAVAKSGIVVAQANANFAKTTYDRWHNAPAGVVAPQETEEKKAGYDSSMAELQAAQAKVSAASANVDRLRALESYKQVTAPFDGVVTSRRIDIGNLVTAGSTTNTSPLYDLAQVNVIRVFADVPQDMSSQVGIGMAAHITSANFPGRSFNGKVARTSRAIDPAMRTLKAEIDIPNPDASLMPGMYVQVAFDVRHGALIEVPASALDFRSAGPEVAVVDNHSTIHFRAVKIALDNGNTVDIGSGLEKGDRVALNISSQIADGDHVTAVDAEGGKAQ